MGQCPNWCEKVIWMHNSFILALCLQGQNSDHGSMLELICQGLHSTLLFLNLTMSLSGLKWVCLCFSVKIQVIDFWEFGKEIMALPKLYLRRLTSVHYSQILFHVSFFPLVLHTTRMLLRSCVAESFNPRHHLGFKSTFLALSSFSYSQRTREPCVAEGSKSSLFAPTHSLSLSATAASTPEPPRYWVQVLSLACVLHWVSKCLVLFWYNISTF